VLAGQPELGDRLEEPNLRQLKQRVTLRCHLEPFDLPATASFIARRILTAGGDPSRAFSREAVELIHQYSGGIPRTICVICDNALISGMALGSARVDQVIVHEVCRDLRLGLRGHGTALAEGRIDATGPTGSVTRGSSHQSPAALRAGRVIAG
jgi:general secretion pathway protein A